MTIQLKSYRRHIRELVNIQLKMKSKIVLRAALIGNINYAHRLLCTSWQKRRQHIKYCIFHHRVLIPLTKRLCTSNGKIFVRRMAD